MCMCLHDFYNHRIQVFTAEGEYLRQFGKYTAVAMEDLTILLLSL